MTKFKTLQLVTILAIIHLSFGFNVDINRNSSIIFKPSNNKLNDSSQFFANSFLIDETFEGEFE